MTTESILNDIASLERKKALYKTMKGGTSTYNQKQQSSIGNASSSSGLKSVKSSSRIGTAKEGHHKSTLIGEYMQNQTKRSALGEAKSDSVSRNMESINKNLDKIKNIFSQEGNTNY